MVNSSLGFQILLYLNTYYFSFFMVTELGVIIFKMLNLPYPTATLMTEILIIIFLGATEALRIFMGKKGNLTEKIFYLLISIGLTIPSVLGVLYLLLWQTYVLRLEFVSCSVLLTLQGLELCLVNFCLLKFCKTGIY